MQSKEIISSIHGIRSNNTRCRHQPGSIWQPISPLECLLSLRAEWCATFLASGALNCFSSVVAPGDHKDRYELCSRASCNIWLQQWLHVITHYEKLANMLLKVLYVLCLHNGSMHKMQDAELPILQLSFLCHGSSAKPYGRDSPLAAMHSHVAIINLHGRRQALLSTTICNSMIWF